MRHLIAGLLLIAVSVSAQTNAVFFDGESMYSSGGGTTGVHRIDSLSVDQITVSTNWGWEDLRFPSGQFTLKPNNTDVTENEANNSTTFETGCSTNRTTDDHIYGIAQMPHTWRKGSDIAAHVHFEQTNADQTNCWYMYYRKQPLSGQIVTAWMFTGPAVNEYSYTSNTFHQLARFPNIDMTGMDESSIVDWKLFRLGSAGTGNIELKEFDIHYQIEKPTGERF